VRSGQSVCYYENSIRRRHGGHYATLTFTLTLPHSWDVVHVAHCYPYSYTDLQRYLAALQVSPATSLLVARQTLAASLAGNAVDVLTITAAAGDVHAAPMEQRRGVVLSGELVECCLQARNACWSSAAWWRFDTTTRFAQTLLASTCPYTPPSLIQHAPTITYKARVHPGETNASWMMKGAIDYLLGPSEEAVALRGAFVFKVSCGFV